MTKVTIFRIDIQNGINQPAIKTFHCNKTIPVGRLKSYRNRIRAIFTNFHRVAITVVFRYKPEESKYDEKFEQNLITKNEPT